jgi:uncharacterized protein YukE
MTDVNISREAVERLAEDMQRHCRDLSALSARIEAVEAALGDWQGIAATQIAYRQEAENKLAQAVEALREAIEVADRLNSGGTRYSGLEFARATLAAIDA